MNFFEKIYRQVFSKQNTPEFNGRKFLVKEMYSMSKAEKTEYEKWINEAETEILLKNIFNGIKHKKAGLSELNERFSVYESPQSNGFYLLCENFLDHSQSTFVTEYIKNKILDLSYILNHSSREIFEERNTVKTRINYYLKPKITEFEPPLDQKFGNIHLEYLIIGDKPDYIKMMANVYSDRNYREPMDFDDLLKYLTPA